MKLKGILYNNAFAYRIDSLRKALYHSIICRKFISSSFRFQEAALHIRPGDRVLDVCSGPCMLRDSLPPGCQYTGLDMSPGFASYASKMGIRYIQMGVSGETVLPEVDTITLLSSLYQFEPDSAAILNAFKRSATRVIVIEDVLSAIINSAQGKRSWLSFLYDYLAGCASDEKHSVLSSQQMIAYLNGCGFQRVYQPNPAYVVGIYDATDSTQKVS